MEKLIRLMTNGRAIDEQTNMAERINELMEFAGITLACLTILASMSLF